jgi:thiol-disulfide isomerase/thioredoxin
MVTNLLKVKTMKTTKIFCTAAMLFVLQQAFAQTAIVSKPFTIKGTLTGAHADSVTLYYEGDGGNYMNETKPVSNNQFTLTGNVTQPVSAGIIFKKTGEVIPRNKQEERMREFYIEPAAITITGDPVDVKTLTITGSKAETEYEDLNNKIAPIREEMKPLSEAYNKANEEYINAEKNKKAESVLDSLKNIAADLHGKFDPYYDRIKKVTYQFFLTHPNSYVTLDQMPYFVSQVSLDSAKLVYNNLNDELKQSKQGKESAKEIQKIEAGSPGSIAANFSTIDISGNPLSLADFKGKYVMLDFWASWCVPCRKGNPHMIEVYNKYKSKGFDIIGIADDDDKAEAWKAAVAKDKVGVWHHVLRGLNWDLIKKHEVNPKDINEKFGIHSLPTKILIDPSGKIVGRYGDSSGGSDEDMDKMLASIFNK